MKIAELVKRATELHAKNLKLKAKIAKMRKEGAK